MATKKAATAADKAAHLKAHQFKKGDEGPRKGSIKGASHVSKRKPGDPPKPGDSDYKAPHLFKKGQIANPAGGPKGLSMRFSIAQAKELAKEYKVMPLDFMLSELNSPKTGRAFKLDCARAAAPYVHRKMPIGIDNGSGGPIGMYSAEQLMKLSDEELAKLQQIMAIMNAAIQESEKDPTRDPSELDD